MRRWLVATAALSLTGCFELGYLSQAAHGQREISVYARPIDEVTADPDVPEATKTLLAHVRQVKNFGELSGLRPTDNYESYADLRRRAAVWVVSAAEPLSFRTKTWSFPIVGEVPYLGWFSKDDALAHARELDRAGWDVSIRPASAYSTLGWFRDPVLSTMLSRGTGSVGDLAETILHESVHATFYVPGQTPLNESVASFLGEVLAERYLDHAFGPRSKERLAYAAARREGERRAALLVAAHDDLAALYATDANEPEKREKKAARLEALRAALGDKITLNNAALAQFRAYNQGRPELAALLRDCGHDTRRLLALLEGLRHRPLGADNREDLGGLLAAAGRCPRESGTLPP